MVIHLLDQHRLLHLARPACASTSPSSRPTARSASPSSTCSATAPAFPICRPTRCGWRTSTTRIGSSSCCATPSSPGARAGRLAYHAITGGFILGEIVKRVTGKPIRTFLREQILAPLGFRWMNYGVAPRDVGKVAVNYFTGPPLLPPLSTLLERALGAAAGRGHRGRATTRASSPPWCRPAMSSPPPTR